MTGSKYTDAQREQALGMLAGGMTPAKVAKVTGIPASTVSDWHRRARENDEDFIAARREDKQRTLKRTSGIVDKGLRGMEKQVTAALRDKAAVEKVIIRILSAETVDEQTAADMANIVREYSRVSLGDLTKATKTALEMQTQLESGLKEQEDNGQAVLVEFSEAEDLAE